jgi:hypothetical protein
VDLFCFVFCFLFFCYAVFGCWENVGKVKFDYCETLRVMFCFHLFATLLATGSVYLTVRLLKKMSLKVETFVLASSSFFFLLVMLCLVSI